MNDRIPAVAYLRVSSDGQVEQYGLDAQHASVTEYAAKNDYDVVETFKELGISGTTDMDDRIALAEMMAYLDENLDVTVVIIPALSRLARDLMIQETILGDLRKRGITVVSVLEPDLCSDDPSRKLVRQIFGAINEYDRAMITMRLKAGRIAKARSGNHAQGRIPIGYKTAVDDNGRRTLIVKDDEIAIVQTVFKLRDERDMSFQKIADYLNDAGYRPKEWTEERPTKFYTSTVQKIYKNSKYRGIVELRENGKLIASGVNATLKIID